MPAPPALSETGTALCLVFILLVPLAAAGVALVNTGLGRARSAAYAMLTSLCVVAIAAGVYFIVGFAIAGYPGRPAHIIAIAGRPWSWIAAEKFFMRGLQPDASPASLSALLQIFGAALAAMIPLGSGSDRWRLPAVCASTAVLCGCVYPLFCHWVWGGGWLAQLGSNYGLGGGLIDAGGAGTIQVVGGLTALVVTWILGPRHGKYAPGDMPAAIPGHNSVLVLFGCLLALLGWIGLNSSGAIVFAGAPPFRCLLIALNTLLAAAASALAALLVTRIRFGKPDASLVANGWVGGLVASSAPCAFISPASAVAIGIVAGVLVTYSIQWLELIEVDDPSGAISVHGLGGLWSLLTVAVFTGKQMGSANLPLAISGAGNVSGQWIAQLVGIGTLLGFVLPLTYGLHLLLDRVLPQRVSAEGERQGMDLNELGAGAYPEFAIYSDEFTQR
jgi:Amt family ammonium transporter